MKHLLLATIIVCAAAAVGQPRAAAQGLAPPTHDACRHYENRARFKPRDGDVEFVTVIADACQRVSVRLRDPAVSVTERAAGATYLKRLSSVRAAIAAMNATRLAGRDRGESGVNRRDLRSALRLVSPSGEFLILRSAGVFTALRRWMAAGGSFDLARALP